MTFNSIAELTRTHRASTPDKTALLYTADDQRWSYSELDRQAC